MRDSINPKTLEQCKISELKKVLKNIESHQITQMCGHSCPFDRLETQDKPFPVSG
jgi:hypothetical protein